MDGIFLPTLHTFAMNNIFTGSLGPFRFRIVPKVVMLNQKEVNMEESSLEAEFWHGPYCYENGGQPFLPHVGGGPPGPEGLAGIPSIANKSAARQGEWFRPPVRQIDCIYRDAYEASR